MLSKLFEKAKLSALSVIPASVSPGNQYAKSFGALMCLAVSADQDFEVNEFREASIFIESDQILRAEGMTTRAVEYFRGYSNAIKEVMTEGSLDFPSVQTELISEVRDCPEEFRGSLRSVIAKLSSVSGDAERAIFARINL